ncbi:MAG: hypothetical protein AAB035_02790 [Nitrospirota bacterium]
MNQNILLPGQGNKGAVLIAVVMVVVLVTALFAMALNNSMIGRMVSRSHQVSRTDAQCAQGVIAIAFQTAMDVNDSGDVAAINALRPGIVISTSTALVDADANDFLEELQFDRTIGIDTPNAAPNITIAAGTVAGCAAAAVDIDFLYDFEPGGEKAMGASDGRGGGGAGCDSGPYYAMTAIVQRVGNAPAVVQSAFLLC